MAGWLGGWVIAKVKELWCSARLSPFNVSTILNQTSIARRIIHPIVAVAPLGLSFINHLLVIEVSPNAQLQALLCQAPPVEESTSSSSSSSASDSSG